MSEQNYHSPCGCSVVKDASGTHWFRQTYCLDHNDIQKRLELLNKARSEFGDDQLESLISDKDNT